MEAKELGLKGVGGKMLGGNSVWRQKSWEAIMSVGKCVWEAIVSGGKSVVVMSKRWCKFFLSKSWGKIILPKSWGKIKLFQSKGKTVEIKLTYRSLDIYMFPLTFLMSGNTDPSSGNSLKKLG